MDYAEVLKQYIPDTISDKLGSKTKVCLMNSRPLFRSILDHDVIVMACNIRIKHAVPGIMKAAAELEAVVGFELAKSEGDVDGGYTGQTPLMFFDTVIDYADRLNLRTPFFIHGDHITVKKDTPEAIDSARSLIAAELKAGYTSFAIDASFNPITDNIRITTELAGPILESGFGLEVEVGEIKSAGQKASLTTVEEATSFIEGLRGNDVHPQLLAINNGSKHGNYLEGEEVHIDLDRTKEVFSAIRSHGMAIAQHGITGTPIHLISHFTRYGIRKGNVGTQWQNIAHQGLPENLLNRMRKWAESQGKDIKFATRPFKEEIDNIPEENRRRIEQSSYETAKELMLAFRSRDTARIMGESG